MRPPSNNRGCVVVGAGPFANHIASSLQGLAGNTHLHCVEDGLSALGQIVEDPPGLLISSLEALGNQPEHTASALRELGEELTMVVVTPPDQLHAARRVITSGFDRYLVEPVDRADLEQSLDLPARNVASSQHTHSPKCPGGGDQGGDKYIVTSGDQLIPLAGETELIDLLLQNRGGMAEAAVRLLGEQVGIQGLQVSPDRSELPTLCTSINLDYAGQTLGVLWTTEHVDAGCMSSAGLWLSRWLALDNRLGTLWEQSLRDDLTGVWNRRYFRMFLEKVLRRAAEDRFRVTLMVYDIDDFKLYNDRYGHAAGDQILCETARLMRSVVREHDVVARVGGDEFAVIFWDADNPRRPDSEHPGDAVRAAKRFREAVSSHRFPKLTLEAPGCLTISGGLASFPWDGRTPDELLELADQMALRSKQQGKNVLTLGPGVARTPSSTTSIEDPGQPRR